MALRNSRGVSLIELMVGLALAFVTILALYSVTTFFGREVASSFKKHTTAVDLDNIRTHLKRFLTPGTIRLFAFTGQSSQHLARVLVPLPATCADLSTGGDCVNSTSMVYVSYEKARNASITAVCALNDSEWLIDTGDVAYGTTTFNSGTFSVLAPGTPTPERLDTGNGQLLALVNGPVVTLWRSVAPGATPIAFYHNGSAWMMNNPGATPVPDECRRQLEPNVGRAGLVKMPIQPANIMQFTNGNNVVGVDPTLKINSMGTFPMRIMAVRLRSVGMIPGVDARGVRRNRLVIRDCSYNAADRIECNGSDFLTYAPINGVSIDETFDQTLGGIPRAYYQITHGPVTNGCNPSNCAGLVSSNNSAIPIRIGSESPQDLVGTAFSMIKQEAVTNIRFRVILDVPNQYQEEALDVPIK